MKLLHSLTINIPIFEDLQQKYPESQFVRVESYEDFERECPDCDALIIMGSHYKQDIASLLKKSAKKLRWIQAGSDGLDKFVIPGIPDGVVITNTSGTKGRTISEHAMGLWIALHQKIHEFERLRVSRDWNGYLAKMRKETGSIEGHTLVLLGYGNIGKEIARKAKVFDTQVIAANRSGTGDGSADRIVKIENIRDVLPEADALIFCMPFTKETRGLIGKVELGLMKSSAVIVNVARGELIDTDAMVEALKNGKLAGAGIDVTEPEPLPADHALWDFENVIISPHVAGHGGPLYERLGELYTDNIERFIRGDSLRNVVNLADHAV